MPEQYRDITVKEDALYKPFVLKRLTDYEPAEKSEKAGSLITGKQLKEDIFDNIEMLFYSRSHASSFDLKNVEELEDSVLGYGVMDFCGRQSSTSSRESLRAHIYRQIKFFEPRLDPETISVEFFDDISDPIGIKFRIGGSIKVKEVEEEVAFVSRLNLESGGVELQMDAN